MRNIADGCRHLPRRRPAQALSQQAGDPAAGLAAWDKIYAVFSHPRCANCHVAGRPAALVGRALRRDPRAWLQRPARRDGTGFGNPGMRCTTCHFASNSSVLHGPPGAETGILRRPRWSGGRSRRRRSARRSRIPQRNGGRTLRAGRASHVRDDPLRRPGAGRPGAVAASRLPARREEDTIAWPSERLGGAPGAAAVRADVIRRMNFSDYFAVQLMLYKARLRSRARSRTG